MLQKSRRALAAGQRDALAGDGENAVVRAYYACFHAATAALHEQGIATRSRGEVQLFFLDRFVFSGALDRRHGRTLAALYQMRDGADHAFGGGFSAEAGEKAVAQAEAFVEATEGLLRAA